MKVLNNKKGAALIMVIILLVVVMIISMSVATIFSNNLKQITNQEEQIQAYYLALSGIELAYSALFKPIPVEGEDKDDYLIKKFLDGSDGFSINEDELDIDNDGNSDVDVTITAQTSADGKREIKIYSVGKLNTTGSSESLTLIIEATENGDGYEEIKRRWK